MYACYQAGAVLIRSIDKLRLVLRLILVIYMVNASTSHSKKTCDFDQIPQIRKICLFYALTPLECARRPNATKYSGKSTCFVDKVYCIPFPSHEPDTGSSQPSLPVCHWTVVRLTSSSGRTKRRSSVFCTTAAFAKSRYWRVWGQVCSNSREVAKANHILKSSRGGVIARRNTKRRGSFTLTAFVRRYRWTGRRVSFVVVIHKWLPHSSRSSWRGNKGKGLRRSLKRRVLKIQSFFFFPQTVQFNGETFTETLVFHGGWESR